MNYQIESINLKLYYKKTGGNIEFLTINQDYFAFKKIEKKFDIGNF